MSPTVADATARCNPRRRRYPWAIASTWRVTVFSPALPTVMGSPLPPRQNILSKRSSAWIRISCIFIIFTDISSITVFSSTILPVATAAWSGPFTTAGSIPVIAIITPLPDATAGKGAVANVRNVQLSRRAGCSTGQHKTGLTSAKPSLLYRKDGS